ncbi:MAG TPA: zf-HC2 domain-containing protein [Fimbriimonadaceae bacterium]|nr:zf-HC2 domain-containing protein [Fimbriimonadaceae bacterium]
MNCKNVQSQLSAYLDEELAGREMIEIREHLRDCRECEEELRCVQGVKRLLGGSAVPEPSQDFEDRLVSRVLAATDSAAESRKISFIALTGIAAASMLATLILLNSMRGPNPQVADQKETMPYDFIQRDRSFDASTDPLSGSPVVYSRR